MNDVCVWGFPCGSSSVVSVVVVAGCRVVYFVVCDVDVCCLLCGYIVLLFFGALLLCVCCVLCDVGFVCR